MTRMIPLSSRCTRTGCQRRAILQRLSPSQSTHVRAVKVSLVAGPVVEADHGVGVGGEADEVLVLDGLEIAACRGPHVAPVCLHPGQDLQARGPALAAGGHVCAAAIIAALSL